MTKGNPPWEQFEQHVQNLLDLRSTPGSGNQWHDQSDGVSRPEDPYKIMVDCKFTEVGRFSLNQSLLSKWWEHATGHGFHMAIPVRLEGTKAVVKDWVSIPLDDYAELVDSIRILNGPRRCGVVAPVKPEERDIMKPSTLACCRRMGHFGHHDNGEVEWSS